MKNSTITKTAIIARLGILLFLALTGCGANGDGFLESGGTGTGYLDTIPPEVRSTAPGSDTSGIKINSAITVTFSEDADQNTLSTASFVLMDATFTPVNGSVTCNGRTATFIAANYLSPSTQYIAMVTTDVTDLSGNHLAAPYTWSFTTSSSTDVTSPIVTKTNPSANVLAVSVNSAITVTFSETMDPSTITASTFIVRDNYSNIVAGSISLNGRSATFTPSSPLSPHIQYSARITTTAADSSGNRLLNDYYWIFKTDYANSGLFGPTFAYTTGSMPEAVAIGDVNGDGRNDIVLTTSYYSDPDNDDSIFIFLQDSSGQLQPPVKFKATNPVSIAVGDINNDGKNEVVVGTVSTINVFAQDGSNGLVSTAIYTTSNSLRIKIADLNHDGLLDVVGIGWGTNTAAIFFQNASGTLDPPVTYSVTHDGFDDLEVADVNHDGLTDIIVMSGQGLVPNIGILTQKPDGTFNAPVYYSVGSNRLTGSVAAGDVNGDGFNDIVVGYWAINPCSEIGVFDQNSGGTLDAVTDYASSYCPVIVRIADVNQDGRKDILVYSGPIGVYLQKTDGTLISQELYDIPDVPANNLQALAIGDVNGDGLNDLVFASYMKGLLVLYHK